MDTDTTYALVESLKLINSNLEKTNRKIEVLERDFKDREVKRRFFKLLIAFYPIVMGILVVMVDADHHKIAEIAGDVSELVSDTKKIVMYASNND